MLCDSLCLNGLLLCIAGSKPTLTQVIAANNGSVSGLTSVGDQLFVVRYGKLSVEVYDTATLKLVRNIQIPNASYLWGAASSTVDNCVYVADHSSHKLHKIELSSNDNVKTWSVAQHPTGLSVNKANNILVCSYASHKIQEYAVNGELVREIVPQVSAKRQFHAVELHLVNNQYALSHASGGVPSQFNLSVVGSDGHISHQSPPDLVTKLAQGGGSLATDSEDNTLACEWQNNQVIVLNSTLTTACRLPLDVDGGLKQPFALHLDETRDRLYVGEWSGQRVLVFDNVFDIGSYLN